MICRSVARKHTSLDSWTFYDASTLASVSVDEYIAQFDEAANSAFHFDILSLIRCSPTLSAFRLHVVFDGADVFVVI